MILPTPILAKNPIFITPSLSTAFIFIEVIFTKSLAFTENCPVNGTEPVTLIIEYADEFAEGPVLPVGPVGPVLPVGPCIPVAPCVPVGPVNPLYPVGPVNPVGPVAPNPVAP